MRIIGTGKRGKAVNLKRVDIQLKISEIDNLIDFLKTCKEEFILRQQDCSVKKLVMKGDDINYEEFTTYKAVKAVGGGLIDCELHYADWQTDKRNSGTSKDIVVHTPLKAEEKGDGTFVWVNTD